MKIIDLFNKIANCEDVPKKIRYRNKIWEYYIKSQDYCDKNNKMLFGYLFDYLRTLDFINDEVEIISDEEEFEDIEEIKMIGCNVKINILNKESNFGTDTPIVTEHCISKINKLIKNQKKIIEKLNKNNNTQ